MKDAKPQLTTMTQKHYSKAPIVEAVVDIKVRMVDGFSPEVFAAVHSRLSDRFPTKSPIQMVQMGMEQDIKAEDGVKFSSSKMELGLRLTSKDNSRILHAALPMKYKGASGYR